MPYSEEEQLAGIHQMRSKASNLIAKYPGTWSDIIFEEKIFTPSYITVNQIEAPQSETFSTLVKYVNWLKICFDEHKIPYISTSSETLVEQFLDKEEEIIHLHA